MGDCYLYGKRGGGKTVQPENIGITVLLGGTRPDTAENNTVWLNTDKTDTDILISQFRPDGEEGNIWLQLAEDGTRILLPGPPRVELPILYAYVHNGKIWQRLEGWLYTANAWKQFSAPFDGLIYKDGDTCDDFTGGWGFDEYKNSSISSTAAWQPGSLLEDRIELCSTTDDPVILGTKQKVPFSGFSTLYVDWQLLENYSTNTTSIRLVLSTGLGRGEYRCHDVDHWQGAYEKDL